MPSRPRPGAQPDIPCSSRAAEWRCCRECAHRWFIVYRRELQCTLDEFHANQALQAECREILRNEAEYLVPHHTEDQGCGFVAKIDIPAGKRLTLYAGRLSKFRGNPSTHYMCMGGMGLGYPLIIDGTPRAPAVPVQASVGQMQRHNHACPPHANALAQTWSESVLRGICLSHPQRQCRPLLTPNGSNADPA